MPESAVTISVDERDDGPLRVGDTLRGTIHLDLYEIVYSGVLELDFIAELAAQGGDYLRTQHEVIVIDRRIWTRGRHEHPFEIECTAPPTHAGEHISLARRLEANLRILEEGTVTTVTGSCEVTVHARPSLNGARIESSEDPVMRLIRGRLRERVWGSLALPTAVLVFLVLAACTAALDVSGPVFFPLLLAGCALVFVMRFVVLATVRRVEQSNPIGCDQVTLSPAPLPALSRSTGYRTAATTLEPTGLHCEVVTRGPVQHVDAALCIRESPPSGPAPRPVILTEVALELALAPAPTLAPDDGGATWTGWLPLTLPNGSLPPLFSFVDPLPHPAKDDHVGFVWELSLRIQPRNHQKPVIEKRLLEPNWDSKPISSDPQSLFEI